MRANDAATCVLKATNPPLEGVHPAGLKAAQKGLASGRSIGGLDPVPPRTRSVVNLPFCRACAERGLLFRHCSRGEISQVKHANSEPGVEGLFWECFRLVVR